MSAEISRKTCPFLPGLGPGVWSREEMKHSPKTEAVEVGETWPKLLNVVKAGWSEVEKAGLEVLKWKLRGRWYHWQNRN